MNALKLKISIGTACKIHHVHDNVARTLQRGAWRVLISAALPIGTVREVFPAIVTAPMS